MHLHKRFNLCSNKITYTVTDNGSNFYKVFKKFHYNIQAFETAEQASEQEQTLSFCSVDDILNTADAEDKYHNIHKHRRCCSHTLTLIATKDSNKVTEEHFGYKKMYESAMLRCSWFWQKTNRSGSKANNTMPNTMKLTVRRYKRITECRIEIFDIPSFTFTNVEFLREYERCMRPIAYALDKLQEDNVYMVGIPPWILAVEHNLQDSGS